MCEADQVPALLSLVRYKQEGLLLLVSSLVDVIVCHECVTRCCCHGLTDYPELGIWQLKLGALLEDIEGVVAPLEDSLFDRVKFLRLIDTCNKLTFWSRQESM